MEWYIGEIRVMAGVCYSKPPNGWMPCDGRLLAISDYTQLYALIGTTYGGDGMSTFALPNLCGQAVMGYGKAENRGNRTTFAQTLGTEVVEVGPAEMPSHSHGFNVVTTQADQRTPGPKNTFAAVEPAYVMYADVLSAMSSEVLSPGAIGTSPSGAPHANIMPSLACYYMIAVEPGIWFDQALRPPPVVNGVVPASGPPVPAAAEDEDGEAASDATQIVTILGQNLAVGSSPPVVNFGGVKITAPVSFSATSIKVTVPPGNGRVPITVTTPNGTTGVNAGAFFTYMPSIVGIDPPGGPLAGRRVRINGFGLTGLQSILFGAVPADMSTVELGAGGEWLTVYAPPAPMGTGTVPVSATLNSGVVTSLAPGAVFTYGPHVEAISPAFGPPTGQTPVTLTGANFQGLGSALQVMFGASLADGVQINGDGQVVCTTPPGSGQVPVVLRVAGALFDTGHVFNYAPVLNSFQPAYGPAGTTVTVNGANFTSDCTVMFGAVSAAPSQPPTSDKIVVQVPAGNGGTVPLGVKGRGGTSQVKAGLPPYSYAPLILGLSPVTGPATGGTPVAIDCFGLGGTPMANISVSFGGAAATVTGLNGGKVLATSPPGTGNEAVGVTVSTGSGGGTSVPSPYFYGSTVGLGTVTPAVGGAGGGTQVTLTGYGFISGQTTVNFGAVPAADVTVTSPNNNILTCTVPAGVGRVDVGVVSGGATSANTVPFSYIPVVETVVPNSGGTQGGGSPVLLNGLGFVGGGTTVWFGSVQLASGAVTFVSESQLSVIPPPGFGRSHVSVQTAGGRSFGPVYSYLPSVSELKPASGPNAGGNRVIIKGEGLQGAAQVMFGSVPATSFGMEEGGGGVWAIAPPFGGQGSPLVAVTVTCTAGTSAPVIYSYRSKVISVSPAIGNAGSTVTLLGFGFTGATQVVFGQVPAPSFTVQSDTQIQVVVPKTTAGNLNPLVYVITPAGYGEGMVRFSYGATITAITPAQGGTGTMVEIKGFGMEGVDTVTFGGVAAGAIYDRDNRTWIRVFAPKQAATGTVPVTLTSSNGAVSNPVNFTYLYV